MGGDAALILQTGHIIGRGSCCRSGSTVYPAQYTDRLLIVEGVRIDGAVIECRDSVKLLIQLAHAICTIIDPFVCDASGCCELFAAIVFLIGQGFALTILCIIVVGIIVASGSCTCPCLIDRCKGYDLAIVSGGDGRYHITLLKPGAAVAILCMDVLSCSDLIGRSCQRTLFIDKIPGLTSIGAYTDQGCCCIC